MPATEKQCPACAGSGVQTCSACNGMGGHSETRIDYDWDNNPIYGEEWVTCGYCNGGYASCSLCGGDGTVQA